MVLQIIYYSQYWGNTIHHLPLHTGTVSPALKEEMVLMSASITSSIISSFYLHFPLDNWNNVLLTPSGYIIDIWSTGKNSLKRRDKKRLKLPAGTLIKPKHCVMILVLLLQLSNMNFWWSLKKIQFLNEVKPFKVKFYGCKNPEGNHWPSGSSKY